MNAQVDRELVSFMTFVDECSRQLFGCEYEQCSNAEKEVTRAVVIDCHFGGEAN